MPSPVVCKLGDLRVRGGRFDWAPTKFLEFTIPRGTDAQIGFHYDYQEASSGKERTRVALSFDLQGDSPFRSEVKIGDTPLLPDAQMGFIAGTKKVRPGEHRGRFTIEADYGTSSWFGKVMGRSKTFRQEGDFVLRVG